MSVFQSIVRDFTFTFSALLTEVFKILLPNIYYSTLARNLLIDQTLAQSISGVNLAVVAEQHTLTKTEIFKCVHDFCLGSAVVFTLLDPELLIQRETIVI